MSKKCDGKMLFNIKSLMLPLDSITEFGDECYAHLSEDETQKETLTEQHKGVVRSIGLILLKLNILKQYL